MIIKNLMLALIILGLQMPAYSEPFSSVNTWKEPRLYHEPFDEAFQGKIKFGKGNLPTKLLEPVYSTNKAYWYGIIRPDFMKEEPWNTSIFINRQVNNPIQITLLEHNNYEVKVNWINEKIIKIEVWWGHMVGTYLIYDVEKEVILAREMIKDGRIEFEQYKKADR